jgi:hypothetical protein
MIRATNDYILGTKDLWDPTQPYDNIHCSYYVSYIPDLGSYFSSWGCLTVRGKKTGTDQWKKFQKILFGLGTKKRVDMMLLTGKDAALAALQLTNSASDLADDSVRLRVGSRGEKVKRLQQKLGVADTGYLGYLTRQSLTEFQREMTSKIGEPFADGIYSPALDAQTGWGIFLGSSIRSSSTDYDSISDDTLRLSSLCAPSLSMSS